MRTFDYQPLWVLRLIGTQADVSCELSVLIDALDAPHFAVRVLLNRDELVSQAFSRRVDAERFCDETRRDLLAAGWRADCAWMVTTDAPTRVA